MIPLTHHMIAALRRSIARLLLCGVTLWCAFGVSVELVEAFEASQAPSCCCKTAAARKKMACAKQRRHTSAPTPQPTRAERPHDYKKCCGMEACRCGLEAGERPAQHQGALAVTASTITFAAALPAKVDPHVSFPLVRGPSIPHPSPALPSSARHIPPAHALAHTSGPPTYLRLLVIRG